MITRIHFENSGVPEFLDRLRIDHDTISYTLNRDDEDDSLYLVTRISNNEWYNFEVVQDSPLLSNIVNQPVDYVNSNGLIIFLPHNTFDILPVTDQDYIVPMVEDLDECPVCMEMFEPQYMSRCGHCICNDCMVKMDRNGLGRCPMCRSEEFRFPIAMACERDFIIA
jgi:hypothetical protein